MIEGTLKSRDGRLYVLYTSDEYSEPYRQYRWWRVLEMRGTGYGERPEAGDVATSEGGGSWKTRNPSTHRSTGSVSTGTGSTKAEIDERVSIHPPAVGKKELRWRDGRWEKLMAKGWVPAGEGKPKESSAPRKKSTAQIKREIKDALESPEPVTVGRLPSGRFKWNLYDAEGHFIDDISAYSAEEALRLAGGPGVASARLAKRG